MPPLHEVLRDLTARFTPVDVAATASVPVLATAPTWQHHLAAWVSVEFAQFSGHMSQILGFILICRYAWGFLAWSWKWLNRVRRWALVTWKRRRRGGGKLA